VLDALSQATINFDWRPIIYGIALLIGAWFVVHKLEFSPTKLIAVISKEMKSLTTGVEWTRGSINGLAIIVASLLLILYFFFDRVRQIIEFLHNAQGLHSSPTYEFAICLFLLLIFALLSARSTPQ
jgi:lysylphosphatidylglycerol synthetase-like protein (DUF2156 family)